jgi:hypothetical protein
MLHVGQEIVDSVDIGDEIDCISVHVAAEEIDRKSRWDLAAGRPWLGSGTSPPTQRTSWWCIDQYAWKGSSHAIGAATPSPGHRGSHRSRKTGAGSGPEREPRVRLGGESGRRGKPEGNPTGTERVTRPNCVVRGVPIPVRPHRHHTALAAWLAAERAVRGSEPGPRRSCSLGRTHFVRQRPPSFRSRGLRSLRATRRVQIPP